MICIIHYILKIKKDAKIALGLYLLSVFISLQAQMIDIHLKCLGGLDERKTKPLRKDVNFPEQFVSFNQVTMKWVCSALPELQHCSYNQILKASSSSQGCSSGNQGKECSHDMQNSHKWVNNSDILIMPSRNSILSSKSSIGYIFQLFQALSL